MEIEKQSPYIYRSHRFCLSTSPQAPGYQSLRLYNILACGGLALVDTFPGLDKLFTPGKHLLAFPHGDAVAALRIMEEYGQRDEECELIRRNGWRLQQAKHNVGFRLLNMASNLTTGKKEFWGWL